VQEITLIRLARTEKQSTQIALKQNADGSGATNGGKRLKDGQPWWKRKAVSYPLNLKEQQAATETGARQHTRERRDDNKGGWGGAETAQKSTPELEQEQCTLNGRARIGYRKPVMRTA